MDISSLKWHRISPGWYQAEVQSPTGTTKISIERQTKFNLDNCLIDYPNGGFWKSVRIFLDTAKFACGLNLGYCGVEARVGYLSEMSHSKHFNQTVAPTMGR